MKTITKIPQITKRETESFTKYLQEVSKLDRGQNLTIDEEYFLAEEIKKGNVEAEQKLILKNLRFVITVAKQYQNEYCPLEDLVNEGNYGLIKAAKRFDTSKGCKFISYAVWWIRQSILCYLNENAKIVRLPLNKIGQLNKIKRIYEKLEQTLGRKPTSDEIIELLDFETDAEEIEKLYSLDKGAQSLNTDISSNNDKFSEKLTLEELLIDASTKSIDEIMEADDLKMLIKGILKKMHPNQRAVIEMHYGLNGEDTKSLEEIALKLDLSKERIRQIKKKSLRILGNNSNKKIIKPYLK